MCINSLKKHIHSNQNYKIPKFSNNQCQKKSECINLVVPVCLSATHVAFGSIRMEPVFMVLGQSAAIAVSMAINDQVPVQDIDYNELKKILLSKGQVLSVK